MPKVAQYEPGQVSTQVTQGARARNLPAAAFDTGLAGLAGGLADVAQGFAQMQDRIDTTAAEEALVGFEREKNDLFFNPDSGYFNTQGRNAFDQAESTRTALQELKQRYAAGLESERARAAFSRSADAHLLRADTDIMRHSAKGAQAWEIATLNAQTENALENATLYWNDPDALKVQNVLGRQAILDAAEREGIGAEATAERLQTFESSFTRASIESATMTSADAGQTMFDEMADRLEGPDRLKVQSGIQKKRELEKTQSDAQMAVLKASNLVDQYDNREDIIAEVDKIEDPELRKKTMTEAMHRFRLQQQAESEAQAGAYADAEDHIISGGSAETFKTQRPDSWERLSAKQKRNLESGKVAITDWNKFSELMMLPRDELAKVNPADHFTELAPAERKSLVSAVRSANGTGSGSDKVDSQVGRTRTSQTTAAVEQIWGKKSRWNKAKRQQVNSFYALLDEEVAFREADKGSRLTSEEFTGVLSDFTRTAVKERPFFLPDTEQDIVDVFEDIPTNELQVLTQHLRRSGIPVTTDNILKAYEQASR